MRQSIAIIAATASVVAADRNPLFCLPGQSSELLCFQEVPHSCYDCLKPADNRCPGQWTDHDEAAFSDCFCAVPGTSWGIVEKCLNDSSSGCKPKQEEILRSIAVECYNGPSRAMFAKAVCNAEARKDPLVNEIAALCPEDGSFPTGPAVSVISATLKPSIAPAPSGTGSPSSGSATPSGTGKPSPSSSAASPSSADNTNKPTTAAPTTGSTPTPTPTKTPPITAGASAITALGSSAMGVFVIAAIAQLL